MDLFFGALLLWRVLAVRIRQKKRFRKQNSSRHAQGDFSCASLLAFSELASHCWVALVQRRAFDLDNDEE